MNEKRSCAICKIDLTGRPFVISSHCYSLINGAGLCSDCAKVDLAVAHIKAVQSSSIHRNELREKLIEEVIKELKKQR